VCIILIKNKKFNKPKKTVFVGFLGGFFCFFFGFFGWVFYCQPCLLVKQDQADHGRVGQVVHDELLAGGADEVPVVAHVHRLRVLQHDDVARRGEARHREARDGEVDDGGAERVEVGVGEDDVLGGLAAAEGVVTRGHRQAGQPNK